MIKDVKAVAGELLDAFPVDADPKFIAGWKAALQALLDHQVMCPLVKATVQLEVYPARARKFMDQLATQGYEPRKDRGSNDEVEHWYFVRNGETVIDYSVAIMKKQKTAFVGVRPS